MGVCYMLQYMDKATLSYATQLGILTDLVSKHFNLIFLFKTKRGKMKRKRKK
jgi:hypothetical protein